MSGGTLSKSQTPSTRVKSPDRRSKIVLNLTLTRTDPHPNPASSPRNVQGRGPTYNAHVCTNLTAHCAHSALQCIPASPSQHSVLPHAVLFHSIAPSASPTASSKHFSIRFALNIYANVPSPTLTVNAILLVTVTPTPNLGCTWTGFDAGFHSLRVRTAMHAWSTC